MTSDERGGRPARDARSWSDERRDAIALQHAALERRRAADTARARSLLDDFVTTLRARGVPPVPLRARVNGRSAYRTGLSGWYLRANGSLAVDTDGRFYVLDTSPSFVGRLRGVRLEPSPPPLHVGVGARDGESMPLAELLERRLGATT